MRTLVIGGIEIPLRASERLTVELQPVQAVGRLRMANGDLKQQASWSDKHRVIVRGEGVIPAGLDGLNYSTSQVIKCIEDKAITSSSNVITVPAARRSDYGVEGRAIVGTNIVKTNVVLVGDEATLTVVPDATLYQAIYWPELTCFFDPPPQTGIIRGARHNWTIEGLEV